jgi:hypothetical protein
MMIASKFALAVAAALLAATALPAVSAANGHGGGIARQAYCQEYRQRAESTGEEYWWSRWRQCMRGWN